MNSQSDIKMWLQSGLSMHNDPVWPMAISTRVEINQGKQVFYSTYSKRRAKIRRAGIGIFSIMITISILMIGVFFI